MELKDKPAPMPTCSRSPSSFCNRNHKFQTKKVYRPHMEDVRTALSEFPPPRATANIVVPLYPHSIRPARDYLALTVPVPAPVPQSHSTRYRSPPSTFWNL